MPRTAKHLSLLRTVRTIRGLTQADLGELVGVSLNTIKDVELHPHKLSRALARRLSIALRLDYRQLLSGVGPKHPKFYPKLYRQYRNLAVPEAQQIANVVRDMLLGTESPAEFFVLRLALYEKLGELAKEFGLPTRAPAMIEVHEPPPVEAKARLRKELVSQ